MNSKIRLFLLFFLIILFPVVFKSTVFAADFKVTGTAIDNKNDPVVNANVTVTDITIQKVVATTTTNQDGYFTFFVPKGTYDITTNPPAGSNLEQAVDSHIPISSDISLHDNLNTVGNVGNVSSNTQRVSVKKWIGWILLVALVLVIVAATGFALVKKKQK